MIAPGTLIEWHIDDPDAQILRVLWIDSAKTLIWTMDIGSEKGAYLSLPYDDVQIALDNNKARIHQGDPYSYLRCPDDALTQGQITRRDRAWASIKPLVTKPDAMFGPDRGHLVAQAALISNCPRSTIERWLRDYYRKGMMPNALASDYALSGGRGKPRYSKTKKLGRPSEIEIETQQQFGVLKSLDNDDKFERAYKRFYLDRKKMPVTKVYDRMLQFFFTQGYALQNGLVVPIILPADMCPTLAQFRYWCRKHGNLQREQKAREGKKNYPLRHRAVLGNSTRMAFGPGNLMMIDATPLPIALVSGLDPTRIIGRPTVYFCSCSWCHGIAGFALTVNAASWMGAVLAVENMAMDKVAFCKKFGIEITKEDWPMAQLPDRILADNGEFEGYDASLLVNTLGVDLDNTRAYRGDDKGLVENDNRTVQDELIKFLPGARPAVEEKGDDDYRLEAQMTLNDLRKVIIAFILRHNNAVLLEDYPMDVDMIRDGIKPYPNELWDWGIKNLTGEKPSIAPEIVRLNLLPQADASVAYNGLLYRNLRYTCPTAEKDGWYERSRAHGRWKQKIAYDPALCDTIYLVPQRAADILNSPAQALEPCTLLPGQEAFIGLNWDEIDAHFRAERITPQLEATRNRQATVDYLARVGMTVTDAQQRQANTDPTTESKSARAGQIKQNRAAEAKTESINHAQHTAAQVLPAPNTQTEIADDFEYVQPVSRAAILKKMLERE